MDEDITDPERLRILAALKEARHTPSRPLKDILKELECSVIYSCCLRDEECCEGGYCQMQSSNNSRKEEPL